MTDAEKLDWYTEVNSLIQTRSESAEEHLSWLQEQMHPYLSVSMRDQPAAISSLALDLPQLRENRKLVLTDTEKTLILACVNEPGSLYQTLHGLREREISFAQFSHSFGNLPGLSAELELQRFDFDRRSSEEIAGAVESEIPERIHKEVRAELKKRFPGYDFSRFEKDLRLFWVNNEDYVRFSPARRVAQIMWAYFQGVLGGGVFFDVEPLSAAAKGLSGAHQGRAKCRVYFAVSNPPQGGFLEQIMGVYKRLGIGIERAYCMFIHNGLLPYFIGTFYPQERGKELLAKNSALATQLAQELFNTQILSTNSVCFKTYVVTDKLSSVDTALVNAFASFCHTSLAHNQPDRFSYEETEAAFSSNLAITSRLLELFKLRLDPSLKQRDGRTPRTNKKYEKAFTALEEEIASYNTGHAYLDGIRRTVYRCCLLFISHTLKTNFYVSEKHALAFRLDPAYLDGLGPTFTADLPPERPYRVTFFFGRTGCGYHIGFSDIARGGWRTVIAKNRDDYITSTNTLFRENYVLAHTQHLKNKDIYEGGSKLVATLDASGLHGPEPITKQLYKLQYGFIQAFLDIFVTENGHAKDPRVVDYYGEDEPIELGPDENMHDEMIELIARISMKRGYLLGPGVMSSKEFGINHKEFGVTSTGVIRFAEITLRHLDIDIKKDSFSVKLTGGPGGDVAGNGLRILLERCPKVQIRLILDGTGALMDPMGADHKALKKVILKSDIDRFDPAALHEGAMMIFRNQTKREGPSELYRKVSKQKGKLKEEWITVDEFYRLYNTLIFTVEADLFIPAGGRPETIHKENWKQFLINGKPSSKAIIEGANSFITPEARDGLQAAGVILMRDASANKCGVISSSYEIIANLLLTEKEFAENKKQYVADVLDILEKRAGDEAKLIFRLYEEYEGTRSYTDISAKISKAINRHYARLFDYFQQRPEIGAKPLYRRALLAHLPKILRTNEKYRRRIGRLPPKYQAAILASELASSLVYHEDQNADYELMLSGHLQRTFGIKA